MDLNDIMDSFPSREEMRRLGQEARMLADDGVRPEAGHSYTVSPDFVHGDRSWIDRIWRVKAISGPNVQVEIVGAGWEAGSNLVRVFRADERAWYLADQMDGGA